LTESSLKTSTPDLVGADAPLVRHTKRPEWGLAILAWERKSTRAYQFEDGKLRKIRKGYYKLLEPAGDDLGDRADRIRKNLRRIVNAGADADVKVVEAVCPFSAQVALFKQLYPGGFEDPDWIEDHRRSDGNPLKRHRSPIVAEAREALSEARCEEAISSDGHEELADITADLLARTDLVPVSRAKALRGLGSEEKRKFVESLSQLLHGEGSYEQRFKAYLDTLAELFEERPSWRLATVLPGIFDPQTHVVVRRSAFLRQAGSIAPTAEYSRRATARSYRNYQRVATETRKRLASAGHEARDLLDIHDFIWTTLRKAALEHLDTDK
jgi:hypothetical protein